MLKTKFGHTVYKTELLFRMLLEICRFCAFIFIATRTWPPIFRSARWALWRWCRNRACTWQWRNL